MEKFSPEWWRTTLVDICRRSGKLDRSASERVAMLRRQLGAFICRLPRLRRSTNPTLVRGVWSIQQLARRAVVVVIAQIKLAVRPAGTLTPVEHFGSGSLDLADYAKDIKD